MRKLAESHIEITLPVYREGMNAINGKRFKSLIKKLLIFMIIIFAALTAYNLKKSFNPFVILIEAAIIVLLCVYMIVIMPRSARKKSYRAMCKRSETDVPRRTMEFFEDHLIIYAEAGRKTDVSYEEISEISETPDLWVLICKDRSGVLISKEGFSLGNFETVREAIEKIMAETPDEPAAERPTLKQALKNSAQAAQEQAQQQSKPASIASIANRSYIKEEERDEDDEEEE